MCNMKHAHCTHTWKAFTIDFTDTLQRNPSFSIVDRPGREESFHQKDAYILLVITGQAVIKQENLEEIAYIVPVNDEIPIASSTS